MERKRLMIIACAALILLLMGCGNTGSPVTENPIPHPPEATALPDLSGEITDIRIRATSCEDYRLDLEQYTGFTEKTLLQIRYGYLSEGKWHDIPAENYDLKGIFDSEGAEGFQLPAKDHLVQIGPYLLICHILNTNAPNSECIIEDTCGTTPLEPFSNYVTAYDENGYGLLTVDRDSVIEGEGLRFTAHGVFGQYYYLLLPVDELSEDYELRITDHTWSGSYDNTREYVLTMDDILDLLKKTNE